MAGLEELTGPPLGRARETALLDQHVKVAATGGRRGVLLVGPAGVGKTTLLRWCLARCREERVALATVRVPTTAGLPPRYPIGEILTGLVRSCDRFRIPVPSALGRAEQALHRLDPADPFPISLPQVVDAIESVGSRAPVAVLIDDYHAAPADGTALLLAALRAIQTPVLLAATARPREEGSEAATPLPEPAADLWFEQMRIEGLEREGVEELLASELGGPALPSLVDAVHLRTMGNPLFVLELVRAWVRDGFVESAGRYLGIAGDPGDPLPPSLHELVASRVARLEPAARSVADVLAVLGRDASFDVLHAVTTQEREQLIRALLDLEGAGFLAKPVGDAPAYRFAHPMYQSVLLQSLGPTQRGALHDRLFDGLRAMGVAAGASATELAHHGLRALARRPDLRALIEQAAQEADAVGSYEESARWYGHLAEQSRDDPDARIRALERQGYATMNAIPREALPIFDLALNEASRSEDVAKLLVGRATARRRIGDLDGALKDLDGALPIAAGVLALEIQSWRATIFGIRGELDEADRLLQYVASKDPPNDVLAGVYVDLGQVAHMRGDIGACIRLSRRARDYINGSYLLPHALLNEGWCHAILGEWDLAADLHEQGLAVTEHTGDRCNAVNLKTNLAIIRAWQGRFADAYDLCLSAGKDANLLGRVIDRVDVLDAFGAIHLEADCPTDALKSLASAAQLMDQDAETYEVAATLSNLAEAYRRLGDSMTALSWIDRTEERGIEPPYWKLRVARVRAACVADMGDYEHAIRILTEAMKDSLAIDPFERAHSEEILAAAKLAKGDQSIASEHLALAKATYAQLGSPHSARRCERSIARRGRPRSPRVGPLTPREVDVAIHVAAGLTDREIARTLGLSERTVSKHVSNMLAKIGAKRRAQIATFAIANGLTSQRQN